MSYGLRDSTPAPPDDIPGGGPVGFSGRKPWGWYAPVVTGLAAVAARDFIDTTRNVFGVVRGALKGVKRLVKEDPSAVVEGARLGSEILATARNMLVGSSPRVRYSAVSLPFGKRSRVVFAKRPLKRGRLSRLARGAGRAFELYAKVHRFRRRLVPKSRKRSFYEGPILTETLDQTRRRWARQQFRRHMWLQARNAD